jgi:hypothetical protein
MIQLRLLLPTGYGLAAMLVALTTGKLLVPAFGLERAPLLYPLSMAAAFVLADYCGRRFHGTRFLIRGIPFWVAGGFVGLLGLLVWIFGGASAN